MTKRTNQPCANYLGVDIYDRNGYYTLCIGSFRFAAESLDEAYRIIDRYLDRDEEGKSE